MRFIDLFDSMLTYYHDTKKRCPDDAARVKVMLDGWLAQNPEEPMMDPGTDPSRGRRKPA